MVYTKIDNRAKNTSIYFLFNKNSTFLFSLTGSINQ